MSYGYDDRGYPPNDRAGWRDPRYDYPPPARDPYAGHRPSTSPPPPEKRGLSRNAKIGIGAGVALLLIVIGVATGGGNGTSTAPAAAAAVVANSPAATAPAAAAPAGSAPAAAVTAAPAPQKAVPNLVGLNHQTAQDTLQAAGFYNLAEEDATGQGRLLVLDRNWHVVSQQPTAGTVISTDAQVMLRSKKYTDP
ncbi:PASTA domain-containing protein [Frankia sp. ACN1ag]|uniref:PASTA domain-containing protein n=1 Tax=Frankia sp. ACN1ag TaxID=102891 RepID=UPI000AF5B835|nr:PASTA domain-containing protein [Frankia sp. ACN1ag]